MKHNLIWGCALELNLFPDAEIAWYLKVQKKFGLPCDIRTDTSLFPGDLASPGMDDCAPPGPLRRDVFHGGDDDIPPDLFQNV